MSDELNPHTDALRRVPAFLSGDRILELFTTVARVEQKIDRIMELRDRLDDLEGRVSRLEQRETERTAQRRMLVAGVSLLSGIVGAAVVPLVKKVMGL